MTTVLIRQRRRQTIFSKIRQFSILVILPEDTQQKLLEKRTGYEIIEEDKQNTASRFSGVVVTGRNRRVIGRFDF